MVEHSRRNFLRSASIGAAAVGVVAVAPPAVAAPSAAAAAPASGPAHAGPFLAWVKDAASGEIAVLVGEHEVIHHDAALARQLAVIAARAPRPS